jgi:hypothetical protein
VALIKCKECGNEISSKAEICPNCGLRLRRGPGAGSRTGCFVSLGKLVGGIVGAVVGLVVAVSLLSNQSAVTPTRQVEIPFTAQNTIPPVAPRAEAPTPLPAPEVPPTAAVPESQQGGGFYPKGVHPPAGPPQSQRELENGLIDALRYDKKSAKRVGKSRDAIQAYMREGFISNEPERWTYTDYYILGPTTQFMGHDLVMIEEEYMGDHNVGCCVSEGAGVTVGINGNTTNLETFARDNGCSFSTEAEFQQYLDKLGGHKILPADRFKRSGGFAALSCRARDVEK